MIELNLSEFDKVGAGAEYCCSVYLQPMGRVPLGRFYDRYEYGVYVNGITACSRIWGQTCSCSTIQPHEFC